MAIIFGNNSPDQRILHQQYEVLKPRGSDTRHLLAQGEWRLGVGINESDAQQAPSSGYYQQAGCGIVVAGEVLTRTLSSLSPADLWRLFQDQGIAFVKQLHGAFVMAIVAQDTIYLVRDAAGQRTLYYQLENNTFTFAIETKGVKVGGLAPAALYLPGLFQYLSYSFVPLEPTLLKGVKELRAGCYAKFRQGDQEVRQDDFFSLTDIPKSERQDLSYWSQRLRQEIDEDIEQKLQHKEEVGVFLSGGLDSSIIAARVAQLHHRPIHTFSIHFGKKYPNENAFARLVASRYQTIHHEVEIKPRHFARRLPEIIRHLDEPSGDPITAPNYELARYAKDHVGCIFNGEGGDPCFGGPKNMSMLLHHWYGEPVSRERAYLASYRRGYQHLEQLLLPEIFAQLDPAADLERILTPYFEVPGLSFLDKLMRINIKLKGAHLILPKVERMLGAHGFVPYAPLFSKKIIESSMEMPANLKLHQGIEKYILKVAFAEDVPAAIIKRPKSGMRVPVRYWFQGELRRMAKEVLSSTRIREGGIFEPKAIKELLAYDRDSGLDRHGLLLWMLLTFELWREPQSRRYLE